MKARIEEIDGKTEAHLYEAKVDDLRAVADHCAALRSIGHEGPDKDTKLVASVPAFLVQKYLNEKGITHGEFLRDPIHAELFLAQPEIAPYRVWTGRV